MATQEERHLLTTNQHGPDFKLDLNQDTKRTTIAKAFYANETVKSLSIFVESNFTTDVCPESLHNLFRAIGSLPLESLYIYSYGRNMDVIPIQLLGDVLRCAYRLEILACYFIELGGGKVSFDKFQDALIEHPSLREIRFESCQLSNRMLDAHSITDKFCEALASLPKLEKLELSASEEGYMGTITPPYLEHLAGTTERLSSLNLVNFILDNDHMSALNRAFRTNMDLTDLAISVNPDYNTKLPALLATTKNLQDVKLQFDNFDNENYLQKIAKGIEKSRNISQFELLQGDEREYLSLKCQAAFAAVPEKNEKIERLDVEITDRELNKKADFFLELNGSGKRELLESPTATQEEIENALAYVRCDLDTMDDFLRARRSS